MIGQMVLELARNSTFEEQLEVGNGPVILEVLRVKFRLLKYWCEWV